MSIDDRVSRAWASADVQKPQATLTFFQELLAEDPSDPVHRFELAGAYDWMGREAEAIEHYESAIAAGLPGDRDRRARIQLGSSLRNVGRFDDAVAVLERVVQDYQHSRSAECFLALALADAGHPRDAVARLVELIARTADDEDSISYREALQRYARNLQGAVDGDRAVSDLMTLSLAGASTTPAVNDDVELRDIRESDRHALAGAYLAAYPPGVAAGNLSEARQEMDDTFAGTFGTLRADLTRVAILEGRPVGAILVVERSIWDPHLDGPFIIDLFVHPDARGLGVGRALLDDAQHACAQAGETTLSLRFGEGSSPAAHALYTRAGFERR